MVAQVARNAPPTVAAHQKLATKASKATEGVGLSNNRHIVIQRVPLSPWLTLWAAIFVFHLHICDGHAGPFAVGLSGSITRQLAAPPDSGLSIPDLQRQLIVMRKWEFIHSVHNYFIYFIVECLNIIIFALLFRLFKCSSCAQFHTFY